MTQRRIAVNRCQNFFLIFEKAKLYFLSQCEQVQFFVTVYYDVLN